MKTLPNANAHAAEPPRFVPWTAAECAAQHPGHELDLSIVLPAYEEEGAIEGVVQEVQAAMAGWSGMWEIIVVDDASRDATAPRAEAMGVRVIRRVQRGGSGAARKTGILAARGRLVAMLDADGSYDPAALPQLLAFFPDYDQVNGARHSEQGTHKWLRAPCKWLIRKMAEWISGKRIPDLNTGMKVFRRDLMLRYLWVMPDGFSCVSSMTLAFLTSGHAVKYVTVPYRRRVGRSKFHPLKDTASYLFTILRMTTYFQPLRVFVPLAGALLLLAGVKGFYNIATSPLGLTDSDILLAVAALLMLGMGLLADLIVATRRSEASAIAHRAHATEHMPT